MRINGLSQIAHHFDAMLVDQFGVLHDGQKLYPGAAKVMSELHGLNMPVVIMTNSGKRAAANVERTVKLGIPRQHFLDCVSSGETAYQTLNVKTAFLVGKRGEDYGFDGIDLVSDPAKADVMLILGSNAPETALQDYERMFRGLSIPAICCNPDRQMLTSHGLQPAPGAIAALYAGMGGEVAWIGKPFRQIYDQALRRLGQPKRVLCIGDSVEHDIAGGKGVGLSTLLVMQGVSAGIDANSINPVPDYIMQDFIWA